MNKKLLQATGLVSLALLGGCSYTPTNTMKLNLEKRTLNVTIPEIHWLDAVHDRYAMEELGYTPIVSYSLGDKAERASGNSILPANLIPYSSSTTVSTSKFSRTFPNRPVDQPNFGFNYLINLVYDSETDAFRAPITNLGEASAFVIDKEEFKGEPTKNQLAELYIQNAERIRLSKESIEMFGRVFLPIRDDDPLGRGETKAYVDITDGLNLSHTHTRRLNTEGKIEQVIEIAVNGFGYYPITGTEIFDGQQLKALNRKSASKSFPANQAKQNPDIDLREIGLEPSEKEGIGPKENPED